MMYVSVNQIVLSLPSSQTWVLDPWTLKDYIPQAIVSFLLNLQDQINRRAEILASASTA